MLATENKVILLNQGLALCLKLEGLVHFPTTLDNRPKSLLVPLFHELTFINVPLKNIIITEMSLFSIPLLTNIHLYKEPVAFGLKNKYGIFIEKKKLCQFDIS